MGANKSPSAPTELAAAMLIVAGLVYVIVGALTWAYESTFLAAAKGTVAPSVLSWVSNLNGLDLELLAIGSIVIGILHFPSAWGVFKLKMAGLWGGVALGVLGAVLGGVAIYEADLSYLGYVTFAFGALIVILLLIVDHDKFE